MKNIILLSLIILTACSHPVHHLTQNSATMKPFEYCGGDMWGYIGPLGKDSKETAFMGVSYLGPKERTFLFSYALELKDKVDVEFEKNEFHIHVNGKQLDHIPVEVAAHRIAFSPDHYYSRSKYSIKLVNHEQNQWEIRKIHPIFGSMQLGDPKIVSFPKDEVHIIKDGKFHYSQNKNIEKTMLITAIPLWPLHKPLTDAEFIVKIPARHINGVNHPEQEFKYTFNMKAWEDRAKSGKSRCPSFNELFWFNR